MVYGVTVMEQANMSTKSIHILGFAGSLRIGSYNAAALRAAQEILPEGMTLEIFDIADIPQYNGDVEQVEIPEPVKKFKERIKHADALLIATPEYNYSVPGVLKNAIDWASRPLGDTPLPGKPVAILGASMGIFGTARAQYHLRQICICLNMLVLNRPEVFIGEAHTKFDGTGKLTDEETRKRIQALLESLKKWTIRLGNGER
jgi:chromate reductase, NAD(P)H dehydrogenase (quinone)